MPAVPPAAAPAAIAWSPWARVVVSLLLIYHLGGVLLEPLATPPQFAGPPSVIPEALRPYYQPYLTALSLDHAYKFFAPNPGESHLMRYDLYFADGTKQIGDEKHAFPDPLQHWPRLLYHRYFMLTEFLPDGRRNFDTWNMEFVPVMGPPPPADGATSLGAAAVGAAPPPGASAQGELLAPEPSRVDIYARGIAQYLARHHGASRVDLQYRVHRLSHPDEILAGRKINEPDTYRERLLLSYTAEAGR